MKNFTLGACILSAALASSAFGKPIYLKAGATGAGDGSSWANAYTNVTDAITALNASEDRPAELRVAGMVPQQSVAVSVVRPDGTCEFEDPAVRFWTRRTVRAEADGLWKVSFDKPASGNLENFRFGVRGVPALVFLTSERYWYFD